MAAGVVRKFGVKRLSEHQKDVENKQIQGTRTRSARLSSAGTVHKCAITDHINDKNHVPDWSGSKPIKRESRWKERTMLESVYIRRTVNKMNRDDGSYDLSHVYDPLLKPKPTQGQGHPRS